MSINFKMSTPPSVTVGTCRMLALALLTLCLFQLFIQNITAQSEPFNPSKSIRFVLSENDNTNNHSAKLLNSYNININNNKTLTNTSIVHRNRPYTAKRQISDDLLDDTGTSSHDDLLSSGIAGTSDSELPIQPANDEQPFGKL